MVRCQLLREDPDLAATIPPAVREWAMGHCVTSVMHIPSGGWEPADLELAPGGIGLLILDGLLIRRVGVDGRFGAELLAVGDVLRPWHGEDGGNSFPHTTGWRVVEPARMAVLDGPAAHRLARFPSLTGEIVGRALDRSRRLALMMAIVHHPRTDIRLHMLLWHLADRWGRVRGDGVLLPLRLSHTVLADLVAAQRPSVSSALGKLSERRLIASIREGWLLCGQPPWELLELQEVDVGGHDAKRDGSGAV